RLKGAPRPSRAQWLAALKVGTLLICGNALVVVAEQWVSSGVAAVAIASVPLWSVLFAGLWGRWPAKGEWAALAVGLAGVAFLQAKVRPALATSYAYVSPVIAVFLGAIVAAENVTPAAVAALALILGGVAIIAAQRSPAKKLQAVSRPEDSIAADSRARTG